jgi:hypothetical protein
MVSSRACVAQQKVHLIQNEHVSCDQAFAETVNQSMKGVYMVKVCSHVVL